MIHIQECGDDIIIMTPVSNWLTPEDQRKLVAYLCKNKPELIREIFCEECPEHTTDPLPKRVYDACECVPLKEYASDYDKGFHQAMTLVRGWIKQWGGVK
jgi:hypothetical protein